MIKFLKQKGFQNAKRHIAVEDDKFKFDLILRIHDIHYLVWYDSLNHREMIGVFKRLF